MVASTALILSLTSVAGSPVHLFGREEAEWIREHVGVYIWPAVRFPGYDHSVGEQAAIAADLGTRIVRLIFEPSLFGEPDFVSLASMPDYQEAIRPFQTVVLTMTRWDPNEGDGFPHTERMYAEFTRYLLGTYRGTGKTFVLGFWEGDNALMQGPPAVEWCNARSRGIRAGREGITSDVRVYDMIECNYDGISAVPPGAPYTRETCMANTLLPATAADLYSFSAWMDLPPTPYRRLYDALDHLADRAPDSAAFGERNVMIGEAGVYGELLDAAGQFEAARSIIAQAREWGVPYVIWWWLSGRECGLVDAKQYGSARSSLWHPFWAAYHAADEVLLVDEFCRADLSPRGQLVNNLGGAWRAVSTHGAQRLIAAVETWPGGGALRLRPRAALAENELAEYVTDLGCLDATDWSVVRTTLLSGPPPAVGIGDIHGNLCYRAWEPELALERYAEAGVDLRRLARMSLRLATGTTSDGILVDEVALARAPAERARATVPTSRRVSATVPARSALEMLPRETATVRGFEVRAPESGIPVLEPRLACGGRELRIVDRVLPGGRAAVEPEGEGVYEFVAPSREAQWEDFERSGLTVQGLRWVPEFHVLMATRPRERCWLETAVNSSLPVSGGEFVIEGRRSGAATWGVTVLSGESAYEAETVSTFQWVSREKLQLGSSWAPSQWIRVRFWLQIDRDDAGWEWDGSIRFVHARLGLDGSGVAPVEVLPEESLVYTDRTPTLGTALVTVSVAG